MAGEVGSFVKVERIEDRARYRSPEPAQDPGECLSGRIDLAAGGHIQGREHVVHLAGDLVITERRKRYDPDTVVVYYQRVTAVRTGVDDHHGAACSSRTELAEGHGGQEVLKTGDLPHLRDQSVPPLGVPPVRGCL
jgi:hypothetical protein